MRMPIPHIHFWDQMREMKDQAEDLWHICRWREPWYVEYLTTLELTMIERTRRWQVKASIRILHILEIELGESLELLDASLRDFHICVNLEGHVASVALLW